jgi:uncharacterized protein (DUF2252 family)
MQEVTERIVAFNQPRIPKMVRVKYTFMQESMFRFFRGTCHLFYEDLAKDKEFPGGSLGWICGDLHLENFGSYRSSNDQIYFDLNDFDEAILAPVTWELVRFVTSIFIGFESLNIEGGKAGKMAKLFLKSYAATLLTGKPDYVESAMARGIICDFLTSVAKRKQRMILNKRTVIKRKKLQIMTDSPKHFRIKNDLKKQLFTHIDEWLKVDENSPYNYKVLDGVFRLAGTGSVGLERYAFLLKSLNKEGYKYILLDMKEASTSSVQPFIGARQPAWKSEADRIISVQRKMQNRCPALLSTSEFRGKSFIMQEMQPTKDSIDFRLLGDRYRDMYSVVDSMAMLTASSHLRSSGQDGSAITDELKTFASGTAWQDQVLDYALKYAQRVRKYYNDFQLDYESGILGVKRVRLKKLKKATTLEQV